MALLTLEEVKAYLRVDADIEDDLIITLIQSAENLCREYAERPTMAARMTQINWRKSSRQ